MAREYAIDEMKMGNLGPPSRGALIAIEAQRSRKARETKLRRARRAGHPLPGRLPRNQASRVHPLRFPAALLARAAAEAGDAGANLPGAECGRCPTLRRCSSACNLRLSVLPEYRRQHRFRRRDRALKSPRPEA